MCASPHISNLLSQFVIHTEHHLLLIMSKPPMHVQEPSVRQQCSGILLQYILDYPLGAKRLQHHLQFLITNLSFEHESGRQACCGHHQGASQHTLRHWSIQLTLCKSGVLSFTWPEGVVL